MPEIATHRIFIRVTPERKNIKITSHSQAAASNPIPKYFAFLNIWRIPYK